MPLTKEGRNRIIWIDMPIIASVIFGAGVLYNQVNTLADDLQVTQETQVKEARIVALEKDVQYTKEKVEDIDEKQDQILEKLSEIQRDR